MRSVAKPAVFFPFNTQMSTGSENKTNHLLKIQTLKIKTMTVEEKKKRVSEWLQECSDNDIMEMHNNYCDASNYPDDRIYENDEYFFNDTFSNAWDAVCLLTDTYRSNHRYVRFDGNGNLESANYLDDYFIDFEGIAGHVIDNDDDLSDTDLRELLNELEEDKESDEEESDEEDEDESDEEDEDESDIASAMVPNKAFASYKYLNPKK
jgi:hypothetical protein